MAISMTLKILTASFFLASAFQEDSVPDVASVCDVASGHCERESFMQLRAATDLKMEVAASPLKPTDIPECKDLEEPPQSGDSCGLGYPTCGYGQALCVGKTLKWSNEAQCSNPTSATQEGEYAVLANEGVVAFQHPNLPPCTYNEVCPKNKPSPEDSCTEFEEGFKCEYEHACCFGSIKHTELTCAAGKWIEVSLPQCSEPYMPVINTGSTMECECPEATEAPSLFPTNGASCDISPAKTCSFSKYCCSGEEKFEKNFKCVSNVWEDQEDGTSFEAAAGTCDSSNLEKNPTRPPTTGQFVGQCPAGSCPHGSLDIRVGDACFVVNLVHNIEPDVTRHIWMHNTQGFCDFDEHCCNGQHLFFKTFYCHDPDGNGGKWVRAHGQTGSSAPTTHEDSSDTSVNFVESSSDFVTIDGTFQKEVLIRSQGEFTPNSVLDGTDDQCPFTTIAGDPVFPKPLNDRNHCSCPEDPAAADTEGDDCEVVLPLRDGTSANVNHHVTESAGALLHDTSFEARTCTWGRLLCCKDDEGTLDSVPVKEDEGTCTPLTGDQGSPCDDHHGHAQICTGTWTNRIDRTQDVEDGKCRVTEDHTEECIEITKEPDYECPTDGDYPEVHTACEGIPNGKCEYDPVCCNGEKKWSRIFECRSDNQWHELAQQIEDGQNEDTESPVDPAKLVCGFSEHNTFTPFDEEKGCPGVCPERREPTVGSECFIEPFAHNLDPLITRHDVHPQHDDVHRQVRNGHCDYDEKCCGGHHIWLKTYWCENGKWALRPRLPHQDQGHENFNKCPDGAAPESLGRRNHCSCPHTFAETEADEECDAVLMPATQQNLDAHHLGGRTCTWGEVCCENGKDPVPEFQRICEPKERPQDFDHSSCINNWKVDSPCAATWQSEHVNNSHCGAVKFIEGTHKCYLTDDEDA